MPDSWNRPQESGCCPAACDPYGRADSPWSKLKALGCISTKLLALTGLDELCREAVELARSCLGFERVGLWLLDADGQQARGTFGTDRDGNTRDERAWVSRGSVGRQLREIAATGTGPALVRAELAELDDADENVGPGTRLAALLWDGQRHFGYLSVDNGLTRKPFTSEDEHLLSAFAMTLGHLISRCTALRARRDSETRFARIFQNSPDAVLITSFPDGRILDVNNSFTRLFGHERERVLGKTTLEIGLWADPAARDHFIRELRQHGRVHQHETPCRSVDGGLVIALTSAEVIELDGHQCILGVTTDITERKRAEENLRHVYGILTDSIEYAARIQRSLLPSRQALDEAFAEHFVIWEPRDVIGGDIFWLRENPRGNLIAIADCTGHGVAGAFVTLIATGALDRALLERPLAGPAEILSIMNRMVKEALNQVGPEGESDDGLGLGICLMDPEGWEVTYAGAGLSLWVVRDGVVEEVKGHRRGIGHRSTPLDQDYATARVLVEEGTRFYLATDGFVDQVGGGRNRTFGKRRLAQALEDMADLALADQKATLLETLHAYQGAESRRDDITVVGFVCAS